MNDYPTKSPAVLTRPAVVITLGIFVLLTVISLLNTHAQTSCTTYYQCAAIQQVSTHKVTGPITYWFDNAQIVGVSFLTETQADNFRARVRAAATDWSTRTGIVITEGTVGSKVRVRISGASLYTSANGVVDNDQSNPGKMLMTFSVEWPNWTDQGKDRITSQEWGHIIGFTDVADTGCAGVETIMRQFSSDPSVQVDEVKLDSPQPKITTVAAMRVRKTPQTTAEEIVRLKLASLVNAVARSTNQDTVSGKTDYWYRVNLANGGTGWVFGGLLLDYNPRQRHDLVRQIIEARLKAENTEFADRQETYNLAVSLINEAKDVATRAEFELLKLLALANWAVTFPDNMKDKSPYKEWLKAHEAEVIPNEFAGSYNLRSELLWNLEARYHKLPIADRIAWEASQNQQPSDCEGDEVCHFFVIADEIKYVDLHPAGSHVAEALKNLTEMLTDEVIKSANAKGGDKYVVEQRTELRRKLASLRTAVAKTSAAEKSELIKKLERVTPTR